MRLHRHLPTVLVTIAVTALAFASGDRYARIGILGATDLPTMPRATEMVVIREGTDYVVPDGMYFVLRGMGISEIESSAGGATVVLSSVEQGVPHDDYYLHFRGSNSGDPVLPHQIPIGFSYPPGTVLRVEQLNTISDSGRAWGYLERGV